MPLLHVDSSDWLTWPIHPEVIFPLLIVEAAYLFAVVYLRPRGAIEARVERSQIAFFSTGVLVLYLATGSIVDHIADNYLLAAHALELVMITLVAAPLLIAGIPSWFLDYPLRWSVLRQLAKTITFPVVALATYNGVLLITHLPIFYDWALRNEGPHFLMHAMWMSAGLLLWWPILSRVAQLPRLSYPLQMGYLFLQSLVPAVMASFITFADGTVYSFYEEVPRIWNLTPAADQQIAGGMMKFFGSMILWTFMTIAFFRWYQEEHADEDNSPRREPGSIRVAER